MASTKLTRTNGSATNLKKFTWSAWVKRGLSGAQETLAITRFDDNNYARIRFDSDDTLMFEDRYSSTTHTNLTSNAKHRDLSAWYHIVVRVDYTQATAADRARIYVNGSEVSYSTTTRGAQNINSYFTDATNHGLGHYNSNNYFAGSMAHVHLTDGYSYAPTVFGETDSTSGIWKPKTNPSVTYGNNGYFLKFANSASLGLDSSGNTNNFTVTGTGTQTQDTPSNNFATFNPTKDGRLYSGTEYKATFSNGNTTSTFSESVLNTGAFSTLAVMGGKWYAEIKCSNAGGNTKLGLFSADDYGSDDFSGTYLYDSSGTFGGSAYGNSFTTGDIIQIAFDSTNGVVWFGKNGTWQNSATQSEIEAGTTTNAAATGLSTTQFWNFGTYGVNATAFQANFGNGRFGTTALASSNSDSAGLGLFEYTVPTGYYALCTKNIKDYG